MQAFNALAELGILYQIDPTSPFTSVQENTYVVDSISFPRETLTRLTGDCDDLTVLYNTILQTAGYETAFVTTPGHIYSAVNTKVASRDFASVHTDRNMLLEVGGEIWVLVEITLIGETSFEQAWSTGIAEYKQYDGQPDRRGFFLTNEAHRIFRPVALREVDLGLQYGDQNAIVQRFVCDLENLSGTVLRPALVEAEAKNTARSWNRYGIAAAKLGAVEEAIRGFEKAGEMDSDDLNSRLNLGSLYYLQKDYQKALSTFQTVFQLIEGMDRVRESYIFKVFLNISRTFYALENYDGAREYFAKAEEIDPEGVAQYSFLGSSSGDGTGRSSEAAAVDPILFFEDE